MTRSFEDKPAVRESVPLLVGIAGPSGSGKSFSALRLATGMQQVTGGEIFAIDSESRRLLHYSFDPATGQGFKFRHIEFRPPFGSLDYLAAYEHCVNKGAKIIITDSASHEHESEGGYLWTHEQEVQRMAGDDARKAERVKFAAWIRPAHERRQLINTILQMNANFIFCFRAKEKLKIRPGQEPEQLGWMPIGGDEWWFEMTALALLEPNARGVPTWNPMRSGEKMVSKLPQQFLGVLDDGKPLSEEHGRKLAEWAKGGVPATPSIEDRQALLDVGTSKAKEGRAVLEGWWAALSKEQRLLLKNDLQALKNAVR